MQEEELLEEEIPSEQELSLRLHQSVIWWENKRLLYNLIILPFEVGLLIIYAKAVVNFGVRDTLFLALAYHMTANFFYSIGWGTEVLLIHYIPNVKISQNIRWVLFIFGAVFSIILTISWFQEALVPLNFE